MNVFCISHCTSSSAFKLTPTFILGLNVIYGVCAVFCDKVYREMRKKYRLQIDQNAQRDSCVLSNLFGMTYYMYYVNIYDTQKTNRKRARRRYIFYVSMKEIFNRILLMTLKKVSIDYPRMLFEFYPKKFSNVWNWCGTSSVIQRMVERKIWEIEIWFVLFV